MTRIVRGLAAVVAVLSMAGCSARAVGDGNLTNGWPALPAAEFKVPKVGDCLYDTQVEPFKVDVAMWPVACSDSHTYEVVAVRQFPAATDARPAVDSPAYQAAYAICDNAANEYLGGDRHVATDVYLHIWLPSAKSWESGNRGYACGLITSKTSRTARDGLKSDGPLRTTCVLVVGEQPDKDGLYETIDDFKPVACDVPHDAEFTGAFTLPSGPYPEGKAADDLYGARCDAAAPKFLGMTTTQWDRHREIVVAWWGPSKKDWAVGDRTVLCYVNFSSTHLVTKSIKGMGDVPLPPKAG